MTKISDGALAIIDREYRAYTRPEPYLDKKRAVQCLLKTYDLYEVRRPARVSWFKTPQDPRFQRPGDDAISTLSSFAMFILRRDEPWPSEQHVWHRRRALMNLPSHDNKGKLQYHLRDYAPAHEHKALGNKLGLATLRQLEFYELLLQAFEAGVGYRREEGRTLLLAPSPLVKLDSNGNFHSTVGPAVWWKGTDKAFYLFHGVHAETIDKHTKLRPDGSEICYSLMMFPRSRGLSTSVYFIAYDDIVPGGRTYMSGVKPCKTVAQAMAWKFSSRHYTVTPKEWERLTPGKDMA